ncbi:MAG: phosphopentomutase, partial [Ignavibacteriales bacterium]|nr:phosphopentomutase [Ignavibacteriales bacterium]
SKGKDSTTGHWELSGIINQKDFPYYPDGFPPALIETFCAATGVQGILGNKAASGTEIIKELGDEHVRSGYPIVYTSADSVFQIAAHDDVIPLPELYEMCAKTRELVCVGVHAVGRVIARPFIGTRGDYVRTANRRDFSLPPPGITVMDLLSERKISTTAIGKIDDLFSGRGLDEKIHTKSNAEGIEQIIAQSSVRIHGLIMANLVDFDMLYGHRQDAKGMAGAIEYFDTRLPEIVRTLADGDLLILTADHGNDPTDNSTDHSREYVPLLCYGKDRKQGIALGMRESFADAGKTVADYFGLIEHVLAGKSFLPDISN